MPPSPPLVPVRPAPRGLKPNPGPLEIFAALLSSKFRFARDHLLEGSQDSNHRSLVRGAVNVSAFCVPVVIGKADVTASPRTSHGRSLMKNHLPAPINPLPDRTPQRSTLLSGGRDSADGAVRHQSDILREPSNC